jgi:formylglycine-generating enzyme required for sulfatase activity
MAQNDWAIVIGINEYEHHPERNLRYGVNDALTMGEFLRDYAGFAADQVFLCLGQRTDRDQNTYPNTSNLYRWLHRELQPDKIGQADRFWFFFSGHGLSSSGTDYLIPCDSLQDNEKLLISVPEVIAALRNHKDADIVLILDNCRETADKSFNACPFSEETKALAKQRGVTTLFSCDYAQFSYELPQEQRGAFTYALVEGLKQHTLPPQLEKYVQRRVAELNQLNSIRGLQIPKILLDSAQRGVIPLLPERVTVADVQILREAARELELEGHLEEAEQIWWQVIQAPIVGQFFQEGKKAVRRIYRKSLLPQIRREVQQEVQYELSQLQQQAETATRQQQTLEQRQVQLQQEKAELELQLVALRQQQAAAQEQWQAEAVKQVQQVQDSAQAKINELNIAIEELQRQLEAEKARKQKVDPVASSADSRKTDRSNTTFDLPNSGGTLEFIAVPGGTLTMEGGHEVTLQPFLLGKYPITQWQYQAVMGENPSNFKGENRPVEQVKWHDAVQFCQKLSELLGQPIDLPSETQWEWAAKGATQGQGFEYAGSNNLDEVGWYTGNSDRQTHPVGQKKPNELGLYDLSGNVWEWCKDNWSEDTNVLPKDGIALTQGGDSSYRAVRGGSWLYYPEDCRCAQRDRNNPDNGDYDQGFRVCVAASAL